MLLLDKGFAVNVLTVGELAKQGGVNVQTIRYYEREGLLPRPPRTASGYRIFPPHSVACVRFIKRAQELGFSLADAKELLDLREHPGASCPQVLDSAQRKLAEIGQKIRSLRAIQLELSRLAKACAGRAQPHCCPLLQALENNREPSHDKSANKQPQDRPMESGRRRGRGLRRVDLLRQSAGAAFAGCRRRVGRQPHSA